MAAATPRPPPENESAGASGEASGAAFQDGTDIQRSDQGRQEQVFRLRCEARALLWRLGEVGLQAAVDVLQAAAVFDGLVDQLGQDAVQEILAAAFGGAPA